MSVNDVDVALAERPVKVTITREAKPKKGIFKQMFDVLIPLLPFLVTGATFVLTYISQERQQKQQIEAAMDTEWRKALEHIEGESSSSIAAGAYQMESFFGTKRDVQARAIAASLLPRVSNPINFDSLFFDLLPGTTQANLHYIVTIDSVLSDRLKELYSRAISSPKKMLPGDQSLGHFIQEPEAFFDEFKDVDQLAATKSTAWALDSVSSGLNDLWTGSSGLPHLTPEKQILDDCIFLNSSFPGVDFRTSWSMKNVEFLGDCTVDRSLLQNNVKVNCKR
jgi:hypothetical protein